MTDTPCTILIRETAGLHRIKEPVRIGIPFPRSAITDPANAQLMDTAGMQNKFQAVTLEYWPDKSVKWALFDFLTNVQPHSEKGYTFSLSQSATPVLENHSRKISVKQQNGTFSVNTGAAAFSLSNKGQCFDSITIAGEELLNPETTQLSLQDINGNVLTVGKSQLQVVENGELRCSIRKEGVFNDNKGKFFLNFSINYSFWVGLSTVQVDFTLHNPRAALHPGGLWDLGDRRSVYFKDLSLHVGLTGEHHNIQWQVEPAKKTFCAQYDNLLLHQNSSGGENWDSPNHLNHNGQKTVSFSGYQVTAKTAGKNTTLDSGERANPWIKLSSTSGWITGTIQSFWQNFPKSLRAANNTLHIALFPEEQAQPFELQGGEQKRHTIFLDFGLSGDETQIEKFQQPVEVLLSPEWIENSKVIPYFSAPKKYDSQQYEEYINHIIEGENSFSNKRETIDEYGWRNYGDTYADHEAVNHTGSEPFISHYNNQYDFIYGSCLHFLKSSDQRWWELAAPAARHMIDIDIYHTEQDKAAYNGGLFWHTDHYQQAKTASHRAYSVKNKTNKNYGGGTSNEHIYTSGLTLYYFLTGENAAKKAVVELADYVLGMDDGTKTIFALFDEGPTGMASQTVDTSFHHPGRGSGNCINCLIDAYRLTSNRRYLAKAEELIQRCIHPADNIQELNLDDPEYRWSYLVFLQILGKYLDYKTELGETDYTFFYARDSLLIYADWMAENEVPYKEVLNKVEIPTETWPAHDIRKCHIFHLAAKYGPEESEQNYTEKAFSFFSRCLDDLSGFKTAFLARPLIILCVYGYVHDFFRGQGHRQPYLTHRYDFGRSKQFVPQRQRFKAHFIKKFRQTLRLARLMLQDKIKVSLF